jgi:hypothetical protein
LQLALAGYGAPSKLTGIPKVCSIPVYQPLKESHMNPLLDIIVRDAVAHSTGASALPDAPVVADVPGRTVTVRRHAGAALRSLASLVEPRQSRAVETAHYGRA